MLTQSMPVEPRAYFAHENSSSYAQVEQEPPGVPF
jgi:hypothetical protein